MVNIGVCGLGRAFSLMLPTFTGDRRFQLVAAATPGKPGRDAFSRDLGGVAYKTMEELCADDSVDVIYIASPHQFHCQHVELAAAAGKHCLLEKPVAISLEEASRIVDAVESTGIKLVVGPCHSFDAPVARARKMITDGELGALRHIQAINYTDFLYRPRRPEELITASGGGVIFSQGIHQIDVVRLLAGGMAQSVFAATGNWDSDRSTEGAYSALLHFKNKVFASLTYSGYAHYDSDELMHNTSELGLAKTSTDYGKARRNLTGRGARAEIDLKHERNLGFTNTEKLTSGNPEVHEHFGLVIVSCDRGDLRLYPDGIEVFGDKERWFESLPPPSIPRHEVMDELYDSIVNDTPVRHSAQWGRASLEVATGILNSASRKQSISMQHQMPL
jgi:phthalate 4,5-cis-dihydrodiol dehydrogenase